MDFLKPDLLRSFGIGFALGCAALFLTLSSQASGSGVVPSAIAAPAQ